MVSPIEPRRYLRRFHAVIDMGQITHLSPEIPYEQRIETPGSPMNLTAEQKGMIPKTHFEYEFDNEGWISAVHVRGHPRVAALCEIPKTIVSFTLWCLECVPHNIYCTNPAHPKLLTLTSSEGADKFHPFRIYKRWNTEETNIPSANINPIFSDLVGIVSFMKYHYSDRPSVGSKIRLLLPLEDLKSNPNALEMFWHELGYPTADLRLENTPVKHLAYHKGDFIFFIILNPTTAMTVENLADKLPQPVETQESIFLEKLQLAERCLGCGYPRNSTTQTSCEFCCKHVADIEFSRVEDIGGG